MKRVLFVVALSLGMPPAAGHAGFREWWCKRVSDFRGIPPAPNAPKFDSAPAQALVAELKATKDAARSSGTQIALSPDQGKVATDFFGAFARGESQDLNAYGGLLKEIFGSWPVTVGATIGIDVRLEAFGAGLRWTREGGDDATQILRHSLQSLFGDFMAGDAATRKSAVDRLLAEVRAGEAATATSIFESFSRYGSRSTAYQDFASFIGKFEPPLARDDEVLLTYLFVRSRVAKIASEDSYMKSGGSVGAALGDIREFVGEAQDGVRRLETLLGAEAVAELKRKIGMLEYDNVARRDYDNGQNYAVVLAATRPQSNLDRAPGYWERWRAQDKLARHPYPDVLRSFPWSLQHPLAR